jgi:hypothetical protein
MSNNTANLFIHCWKINVTSTMNQMLDIQGTVDNNENGETVSAHGRVNRRTLRKPMPTQVSSYQSLHKIQIHLEGEEVYYPYTNTLCLNT